MTKHNYSQYSNKKKENKVDEVSDTTLEIQNGVETTVNEEVEAPVVETETTIEATVETETNSGAVTKGVVTNCAKLNVRSKPSISGDVVCVLDAKSEVTIDVDESTDDWFKVRTVAGVKGYCMREFVNANI